MDAVRGLPAPDWSALRRRSAGIVLTLVAEAILVLMLLTLAPYAGRKEEGGTRLITVPLPPSLSPEPTAQPRSAQARQQATAPPRPSVPPPPVVVPPVPWTLPPDVMEVTREVYAASDISRIQSTPRAPATSASAGNPGAGDSEAIGTAPNGEPLYAAEWVREPTNAELSFYLPKRMSGPGWAIIACKTVPRFKVDECVPLGESAGSGLGYAIQQAAWQFQVRPPRLGGKLQTGTWVRIRIDFTDRKEDGR